MAYRVFPLFVHCYFETEVRFTVLAHRHIEEAQARIIFDKINSHFSNSVEHKGRTLSENFELILEIIKKTGYRYNQDCFLGIEFIKLAKGPYLIDELPEPVSTSELIKYIESLVNLYAPLYILDPFPSTDSQGLTQLEALVGELTLIGSTYVSPQHMVDVSLCAFSVHNTHHLSEMKESTKVLKSGGKKIIAIVDNDLSEEDEKIVISTLNPDFLERL